MDKKLATLGMVFIISFIIFALYIFVDGSPTSLIRAQADSAPSLQNSLVFAWELTVPADGASDSEISVFIRNTEGRGLAGKPVELKTNLGQIKEGKVLTDNKGKAVFHIASSEKGVANIQAFVENKRLFKNISIKFE